MEQVTVRVTTQHGRVEGYADAEEQVLVWKGVPFAAPPIGDRRWTAPVDPKPWVGVREAKTSAAPCAQLVYGPTWKRLPVVHGSEDCLYLDVYRPLGNHETLPVFVWVHGGANNSGCAAEYHMGAFARRADAVVVVPQYRLNVFGFFSHAALRAGGSPEDRSGNYGALDQHKALRWVRDNIHSFGGDPANVTVAGESAGAHDVSAMLISPMARGLFHRAVMQSGFMRWDSREQADVDLTRFRTHPRV